MSNVVQSTLEKVERFVDRIRSVRRGSSLATDTKDALLAIEHRFARHQSDLRDLMGKATSPDVMRNYCDVVLGELFRYLPYVGFLHRARHASNPFEIHGPLKRLAVLAIGDGVRLIISSEWEFSPYTHLSMGDFPEFVLLGLPASEADNALLIPIAGHEFGHSVWVRERLSTPCLAQLTQALIEQMRLRWHEVRLELPHLTMDSELVTDTRARRWWLPALSNALAQCEEVFCDLLGLWVFGDSYCRAFAHLLAPGLVAHQSSQYPSAHLRATILAMAAPTFGLTVPAGFVAQFSSPVLTPTLPTELTAAVVNGYVAELIAGVQRHAAARSILVPSADGRAKARDSLVLAVPADTSTLPELLCAAWDLRVSPDLWASRPYLASMRERVVNELVLKSAQTMDYWYLQHPAA